MNAPLHLEYHKGGNMKIYKTIYDLLFIFRIKNIETDYYVIEIQSNSIKTHENEFYCISKYIFLVIKQHKCAILKTTEAA